MADSRRANLTTPVPWLGITTVAGVVNLGVFELWIVMMFWAHIRAMCTESAFVPRGSVRARGPPRCMH